jgi:hypothetical protein
MSSSHRLLIIHSPQVYIWSKQWMPICRHFGKYKKASKKRTTNHNPFKEDNFQLLYLLLLLKMNIQAVRLIKVGCTDVKFHVSPVSFHIPYSSRTQFIFLWSGSLPQPPQSTLSEVILVIVWHVNIQIWKINISESVYSFLNKNGIMFYVLFTSVHWTTSPFPHSIIMFLWMLSLCLAPRPVGPFSGPNRNSTAL